MVDNKGNLRRSKDYIIYIKIRDDKGVPQHSSKFRLDDRRVLIREFNILKDKFGVDCFTIKDKHQKVYKEALIEEVKEEKEKLNEFREKTKSLREYDETFRQKMRDAFSL